MASAGRFSDLFAKASLHFSAAQPLIPMYIHLILSALFPIYTGAHASLSRPSSAGKPDKAKKAADDEDEDEDEEIIQKMEGMSNTDAIVLPVSAGLVLAGLYFLIMKYGADMINLVLGWYFSGVGVYSVAKLVNDGVNFIVGFVFPNWYAKGGALWRVVGNKRKVAREDGDQETTAHVPVPFSFLPLPRWLKTTIWSARQGSKQKYTFKAYVHTMLDLRTNLTIINVLSAFAGLATIIYVNTVSKPWFLTNLQGFAVSYSALQLMSPTTFATGSLILGALFCYDIWAVFFTPLMVTVAKNLDQPIKLVFPRPDEPSEIPGKPPVKSFSMLGLGDIVLPGIMIGLALRFDLYMFYLKKQQKQQKAITDSNGQATTEEIVEKASYVPATGHWGDRFWTCNLPASVKPTQLKSSFPKPYFTAAMTGYIVGMLTTLGVMSVFQHAQPALLYLVPGVLISLWGTALVRGELSEMWDFSEAATGEQLGERSSEEQKSSAKEGSKNENTAKGLFERLWQEIWGGSDKEQKTKPDEENSEESSKSTKSKQKNDKETELSKNTNKNDDLLFSFSVSRYNPKTGMEAKTDSADAESDAEREKAPSSSGSESSDDAVVVSPEDVDDTKESETAPRRRTRSMRAGAADQQ